MILTQRIKLDGKRSSSFVVTLKDDAGELITSDVLLLVRGFLKFSQSNNTDETVTQQNAVDQLAERSIVYPVLFSEKEIIARDGKAVITLLPRSEDILQNTAGILSELGFTGTIESGESTGSSNDNGVDRIVITHGQERVPYSIEVQITILDTEHYGQTTGSDGETNERVSRFAGVALQQGNNISIECYSDIEWIPTVSKRIFDNDGSASEMLSIIDNLSYEVPFGGSPLYDALVTSSDFLSDNSIDNIQKILYVLTDNESNLSVYSIDEAIEQINAIDGQGRVPVLIGNFSVVFPITLSAKANITDVNNLLKIAYMTNGQSVTVLSEEYKDELVSIFVGQSTGSVGYGEYRFTVDLETQVTLNTVSLIFTIPENTSIQWSMMISNDGYNFVDVDGTYQAGSSVNMEGVNTRYIRFTVIFITGFFSVEHFNDPYYILSLANSPKLVECIFTYNKEKVSYLILNSENTVASPQNVVLCADINNIDGIISSQTKAGVTTSDSHNWLDFDLPSQLSVDQDGKTIIPVRFSSDDEFPSEYVYKIDRYAYRAKYGRWNYDAVVIVYDSNGNVINPNLYKASPRDGLIVFNSYRSESQLTINIIDQAKIKPGFKFSTTDSSQTIRIDGIGYMYNTNINLSPPIEKLPPEAKALSVLPISPEIYQPIFSNYTFYDINFDLEDITGRVIKWYINDVYVPYLDNRTKWNDITNANDPIYEYVFTFSYDDIPVGRTAESYAREKKQSLLHVGDTVHFTIKVSDGQLFSPATKSPVVKIVEGQPIVSIAKIWAMDTEENLYDPSTNVITDRLTSDRTALLVYSLISDIDTDSSEIIWYVNDAEFKKGTIVSTENIDRIVPGETNVDLVVALRISNEIYAKIIPYTGSKEGQSITTDTVVVKNALPEITSVIFTKTPRADEDMTIVWEFFDNEINMLGDGSQSDNTRVEWYKYDAGLQMFKLVTDNTNIFTLVSTSTSTVSSSILETGQIWKARVIPNDSLDDGIAVESSIVTIL